MPSLHRFSHRLTFNVLEWHDRLKSKGFSVLFCWVPSHVRVSSNELADNLAKSATNSLNSPVSLNDIKKLLKKENPHFKEITTQPSASSTSQMEFQEILDPPADNITESPTKLFYKRKVEELDDMVQVKNKKMKFCNKKCVDIKQKSTLCKI
ncbi:hypothetical protein AVEN_211575-1 [Araneus ventricosus]|uniref:Uncharacterized protein n=1 Tax=Araneus ventricosus TaxID=182803 RepID=A0A4Y2D924_ARAVE|nr:hypothetical protein AVEN_211575-1 [Araneus ventricosus]